MTSNKKLALSRLFGDSEVIAFRPAVARALGSVTAALFLCQATYWQNIVGGDKWWFKLRDAQRDANKKILAPTEKRLQSWEWETGLTRAKQQEARALLRRLGLLEEKREGIPARLYYRIDLNALKKFLTKLTESRQKDDESQPIGRQESAGLQDNLNQHDNKNQPHNTKSRQRLVENNNNGGKPSCSPPVAIDVFDGKCTPSATEKYDKVKKSKPFQRLTAHGIGEELAIKWIHLDEKRVTDVIDYVEERILKNQLLNSSAGYIRSLIENPKASLGKTTFTKSLDAEKQKKKQSEEKATESEKNAYAASQKNANRVKEAVKALTLEQRQQHAKNFMQSEGAGYKSYESSTGIFKDARDRIMFRAWLQTKITLGHLE